MKHLILIFLGALCCSCSEGDSKAKKMIVADLTKSYPSREICLQDIAEIEYIPLSTSDSMLVNSFPLDVSTNGIATRGGKVGEVLLFDGKGQNPLGRICRAGQGAEEYTGITFSLVDWKRKEVFVIIDFGCIKVYDFTGKYIRSLVSDNTMRLTVKHLNESHFLCSSEDREMKSGSHPYFTLSKEDGKVDTLSVKITQNILGNRKIVWDDGNETQAQAGMTSLFGCQDKIWLTNNALDTIFLVHPDLTLEPVMIPAQAPTKDEEAHLLRFLGMNNRYAWISRTLRNVTVKMSDINANREKQESIYMYDRITGEWILPIYRNRDLTTPDLDPKFINTTAVPYGYGLVQLSAMDLVGAYQNNQIVNEKLKKIASTLQEEDNSVLMLLKFKE